MPSNVIWATNTTQEGGLVRFSRIRIDKYNTIIVKVKDTINKVKKIKENGDDDDEEDHKDNDDSNKNDHFLSESPRTRK